MSSEHQQDSINKRKVFTRSDAVVCDDDNKMEQSLEQTESPKKRFSAKILQKDNSYDSMGIDVLRFVENTLHKNSKDREFLLFIEDETRKFVEDESKSYHFFPPMSSYNRMLIHRVAAFFGLIHNVDQSGQQVVVTKQKGVTRVPDLKFNSLIKHSNYEEKHRFGRRNVQSFDESNISTLGNHRNNSSTTFGPPSSFRTFRNRFYTATSHSNNSTEINKGRRTRSFEISSDWSSNNSNNISPLWNQHFAPQFCHLQPSTNLEIVTAGMGETTISSNCSSSAASSGAVQLIYPSGQFLLTNETSLISPSSAFSEPPTINKQQLLTYQGLLHSNDEINGEGKEEENNKNNNLILTATTKEVGGVHVNNNNIPSLFSFQPIIQQNNINNNINYTSPTQNYQSFVNPYLALQYQENTNRPIERQFEGLSVCHEQNNENNNNGNGQKYNNNNGNNNNKPTCY